MSLDPQVPPSGTIRDWLATRAAQGGAAIVFPETGETLSWPDSARDALGFASVLTTAGARKGESVAVIAPNSREGVTAFYGATIGGFRATMINLAAGQDAISYALGHSEARFAYVHPACRDVFGSANQTAIEADLSWDRPKAPTSTP